MRLSCLSHLDELLPKPRNSGAVKVMAESCKISTHPRRPAAHLSVSLLRTPSQNAGGRVNAKAELGTAAATPASDEANPPSSGSDRPGCYKQSSGESSNAENWFEASNNNVTQSGASFLDNDPPFFMPNSSSDNTPPEMRLEFIGQQNQRLALPYRAGVTVHKTDGSSVDDFRGVIDDLTVENKNLKTKLKKYEKLHSSHLQQEKLFEVKVHGLPLKKKKELEDLLRNFALSVEDNIENESVSAPGLERAPPLLRYHPTSSSLTSRFAESGYASLSASGQNSATASGYERIPKRVRGSVLSNSKNIQSYLHDIPVGLLSRQPITLSDI